MTQFLFQIIYIIFTFFAALFKFSIQETLSCGTTNFQVTFEPSRPIFSNTLVAKAAIAASGTNNANSGNSGSGTLSSSGISVVPTTKYLYQPLDSLLSNAQVCNLSQLNNNEIWNSLSLTNSASEKFVTNNNNDLFKNLPESRMIITKCDECSKCPHELSTIYQFLSRLAVEANLRSLLVIIHGKDSSSSRSTSSSSLVNGQFKELERIKLMDNAIAKFVFMNEEPGQLTLCELIIDNIENDALKNFSRTSVLFVSISFIILMVISLAWLIFYYVQRFRYAHAKDRLQRRLFNAAKKALSRIPTRPVKAGDKDLDMDCPVCIDPYKTGDIVRMLPCKHTFHKGCVDPWLLEHRTCPMCKSDILKAFGFQITINNSTGGVSTNSNGRRRTQFSGGSSQIDPNFSNNDHNFNDSAYSSLGHRRTHYHHRGVVETNNVVQRNSFGSNFDNSHLESSDIFNVDEENSINSKINTFSFPIVNESHDPFSIKPSSSPQLIQVVHTTNARGFTTIPLTVHNSTVVVDTHNVANELTKKNNYNRIYSDYNNRTSYSVDKKSNELNDNMSINYTEDFNLKNNVCKSNVTPHLYRAMTSGSKRSNRGQIVNLIHVRSRSLNHGQFPFEATVDSQKKSLKVNKTQEQFNTNSKISNKLQQNIISDLQLQNFDKNRSTALLRTIPTDNLKQQTLINPSSSSHTKNELQKLNIEISSNKQILNKTAPPNKLCIKNNENTEDELILSNQEINLHSNKDNIWENVALNLILTLPNCVDNNSTISR